MLHGPMVVLGGSVESVERPMVLLIDDDRLIRLLVRKALEGIGCRVVEAETGEGGVAAARAEAPDLILLDFHLPDQDAPDVARALRASPSLARTPILLLSASQDHDQVGLAVLAGVDGAIAKPVNGRVLAERVRFELEQRSLP